MRRVAPHPWKLIFIREETLLRSVSAPQLGNLTLIRDEIISKHQASLSRPLPSFLETATWSSDHFTATAGETHVKSTRLPYTVRWCHVASSLTRPRFTIRLSRTIRSLATGTRLRGPMKSRILYEFLPSRMTESDSGLAPCLDPPKEGRKCLMSPPILESQGCHLIPLYYVLCCSST